VSQTALTKVFITGKNGQVGRELVERAAELKIDAVSFDSSELDICDREKVIAAIAEHKPSVVINAAAYTAVDKAETEIDQAYAVNCDGVENLALACKSQNIPLIHISTDYVFDGEKEAPYLELDTPNPKGVYGASKYAGEQVLRATWEKHIIVRVSWVFGRHGNNFVKTMLHLAKDKDEISVVNDQFGAPTSTIDIARVLLNLSTVENIDFGLYHLESNPKTSWYGFAVKIFEEAKEIGLLEKSPVVKPISSAHYPTPTKRPVNSKLATDKGLLSANWPKALSQILRDKADCKVCDK
jgi:dTDP-4-dehydrorhamnose reductase